MTELSRKSKGVKKLKTRPISDAQTFSKVPLVTPAPKAESSPFDLFSDGLDGLDGPDGQETAVGQS